MHLSLTSLLVSLLATHAAADEKRAKQGAEERYKRHSAQAFFHKRLDLLFGNQLIRRFTASVPRGLKFCFESRSCDLLLLYIELSIVYEVSDDLEFVIVVFNVTRECIDVILHISILLVEKVFVLHHNVLKVLHGPVKLSNFLLISMLVKLY